MYTLQRVDKRNTAAATDIIFINKGIIDPFRTGSHKANAT